MSGVCGWISREPGALPIRDMAAALHPPGASAQVLHCASNGMGALALAGGPGLYQDDGLLIAHWGERPDALARLWRSHGVKACAALSGQFAFALLDETRAEALLAVDRCASRPLFYQMGGRTLMFASAGAALARHPGAGRDIDPQAIHDFLYLHALPGTLHEGQRRLAPGECLHLRGGRAERVRYWRMRYTEHALDTMPQAELRNALSCAADVARTERPHMRPAVLLAGGGAGVAMAAALQHAAGTPLASYTAGYAGDERALAPARSAARRLGTRHHEAILTPREVCAAVPLLAAACDSPCGDPAAVGVLAVARLARAGGATHLAGAQGAAQLFGCGRRLAGLARPGRYERLPGALRQLAIEPLLYQLGARVPGVLARLRARIEGSLAPLPARLRRANLLRAYGASAVFEPAFLELVDPEAPAALQDAAWWSAPARSAANRLVELERQIDLPGRVLPAFAGACAAAGVEALHPWLDEAALTMAARLAPAHKTPEAARKLFARALRDLAPGQSWRSAGSLHAPRLPLGRWLQEDAGLRALAGDSLNDLARRRIVRRDFLDLLLARRLPEHPDQHAQTVWLLMMLEQWFAHQRYDGGVQAGRQDGLLPLAAIR